QVASAVVKEAGLPGFAVGVAAEGVLPPGIAADIATIDGAVGAEEFGGNKSDAGAGGTRDTQARHHGGVLAEVVDVDTGANRANGLGREQFMRAKRRRGVGSAAEQTARTVGRHRGCPGRVIVTG